MTRLKLLTGLALAIVMIAPLAAQEAGLVTLRGDVAIEESTPAPIPAKQNTTSGRFQRAYRQQPPMIPHRIRGYQIDLKANKCMSCHDWPNNVEQGAPKISETHYFDRAGVALDRVARTRWFCTQCHVPQANVKPLVDNGFVNAINVE